MSAENVTREANAVTRRSLVLPTLALVVVLFAPAAATAHDLRATVKVEADAVRVEADYEGEDPVQGGAVTLTDASGAVVASGTTDDRGECTCPRPAPGSYTVVVEQAGHRRTVPVEVPGDGKTATVSPQRRSTQRSLMVGLGVVFVASLLFRFARRKPGVPADGGETRP